jgi:hypothetical protein
MADTCQNGNESFVPWNTCNFLRAEEVLNFQDGFCPVVLIYESLLCIHNGSTQLVSPM